MFQNNRHLIKTFKKLALTLNITLAKLKLFSLSFVFVRKIQGEQEHPNYEREKIKEIIKVNAYG